MPTLFEKIWDRHVVAEGPGGQSLLYIDRHLLHEGATHAFARLRNAGRAVRRPAGLAATADHYVPTGPGSEALANDEIRGMVEGLQRSTREQGVTLFRPGDPRQGIVHVIGPEQGLTQPGILLVCGDSHTATHGAFGALAFGIGSTEVEHVLATQCLWQKKPRTMRITVTGERATGITAKDVILAIIAKIGAAGGVGHAIEYAGPAIAAMSMEERMTVCNMSIEAGARAGMIAPDATTFAYVEGRPYAPKGELWSKALEYWKTLPSDPDAVFDREVELDAGVIAPTTHPPADPASAFVPIGTADLEQILCHEDERVVARDNTVSLDGLHLQIDKQRGRRSCVGLRVLTRRHLDGRLSIWWGPRCLGTYDAMGRPLRKAEKASRRGYQHGGPPRERGATRLVGPRLSARRRVRSERTPHARAAHSPDHRHRAEPSTPGRPVALR